MQEFDARITDIIERTPHVKSFRFERRPDSTYEAGQYLLLSLEVQGQLKTKAFSFSSSPTEDFLEFTKKLTSSAYSHALEALAPGDAVKVRMPSGTFTYNPSWDKIAFLSGGIGITPIRSIIRFLYDTKAETDIVLVYGNRKERDITFRQEFAQMQRSSLSLNVLHILSEPDDSWEGRRGLVDAAFIRKEIPDWRERYFLACGPPAMVDAMKHIVRNELELPAGMMITENFTGY